MWKGFPDNIPLDEHLLDRLAESFPDSPPHARLKAALMFAGIQYDEDYAAAGDWAYPSYMPYQLPVGVPAFRGKRSFYVPYLARMSDNGLVRLRIKADSPFRIRPDADPANPYGYLLYLGDQVVTQLTYEPKLRWSDDLTSDGTPMRATGLSQHGDMLIMNVAPGCEYFKAPREDGTSENVHCKFCLYGMPDKQRLGALGQDLFDSRVKPDTLDRVMQACHHPLTGAKQLYLVGGSMLDMASEGDRFVQISERLHEEGLMERYYVACGSGAIPKAHMRRMRELGVRGASFNLEVWNPEQFARICPGKNRYVGRDRWLRALDEAVEVFGPDDVYSAFVAGVELEGDGGLTDVQQVLDDAIEAAEYLIPRGIQPLFSLYWRVGGKSRDEDPYYTLPLFLAINDALAKIRRRENRLINPNFLNRRGAYMQLEPDFDEPARPADLVPPEWRTAKG